MNNLPHISIKAAGKHQLQALYRLEQGLFGAHAYPDFFFRQSFDCWPSGLRVACDENECLLGYILLARSERVDSAWILSVAVDSAAQGRGIGRRLIVESLGALPASVTQVKLTVAPDNPARHLYARLGFVEQGLEADYFGPDEDRVLMTLSR
ncbi:GNAT family N-acetyltransferase [Shewanella sp. cp20]|uniref:GNAT family N-acetyltransferase n=1 Tax=Shewanella sp. cp20 TaxID=1521167 RepID=UPI00059F3BBF|nr:N-acetyltransferase [Shewanella sp. cp20]KIO37128.1 GCN5 family acetyltransferase [Shewanella sp. cp20]